MEEFVFSYYKDFFSGMIQVLMVVIQGKNIQTRQLFEENVVMAAEMHIPPQTLRLQHTPVCSRF